MIRNQDIYTYICLLKAVMSWTVTSCQQRQAAANLCLPLDFTKTGNVYAIFPTFFFLLRYLIHIMFVDDVIKECVEVVQEVNELHRAALC